MKNHHFLYFFYKFGQFSEFLVLLTSSKNEIYVYILNRQFSYKHFGTKYYKIVQKLSSQDMIA